MGKRSREDEDQTTPDDELPDSVPSPAKIVELHQPDQIRSSEFAMQCSLPPHKPLSFDTADDFDLHYAKEHTNRCASCGKNFPTPHFLALHLDENHNPVREALAAKGDKTYACFIEDCDRKCSSPQKRRLHLIDKHMFPRQYHFRVVDTGIDSASSMLQGSRRRRLSSAVTGGNGRPRRGSSCITNVGTASSTADSTISTESAPELLQPRNPALRNDSSVDDLVHSISALHFVPSSVQAKQRSKKQLQHD